ncbi:hypothetical protein SRHO_G00327940 [Serrasalmus rhombeus]
MKPKGFGTVISAQLHHFCDASEVGYGTVSYIRFASDRNVHVSFVVGKARVAPLKQMTIPRLELQAATLASRMDKMLRVELQMNLEPSVIWTESQSVLKDINNEQTRFSTFVTNRLTVIRDLTTKEQWRYVGSANNPADAASRGVRAVSLMSKHWWTGPDFLRREETHWPIIGKLMSTDLKDLEVRNVQVHWTTVTDNPTIKFLEYYSQWNHFKRALAWFLRLKDILKTKIQGKDAVKINSAQNVGSQCLSVDELERAENAVISYVQNSSFHEEVEALQKDVFKEKRENRRWQISVQNGSPQTYHLLPIDILLDSEPDEDPQMLSSPKHPYSPCDEMENLADIIRDFKRENISEHSTLTVVARRRRILHSAITALNKGYFDWHKRPQIEFVGEMADDYGGPTREFFRNVFFSHSGRVDIAVKAGCFSLSLPFPAEDPSPTVIYRTTVYEHHSELQLIQVHVGSKTSHFTYSSGLNQNYIQVDLCTPRFSVPSRPADLQDDWMTLAVTLSRKQIDLWAICN